MRLLVLTNLYPPDVIGGYELACANVARGLAGRGHDVHLLTSWSRLERALDEPSWVDRSLDLHWFFRDPKAGAAAEAREIHSAYCSYYPNTARLLETLRSVRPDLVYVWNVVGLGSIALLDLLNIVGIPWVMHLMDCVPGELLRYTPERVRGVFNAKGAGLYRNARILAMSEHLLGEISAIAGIAFSKDAQIVPGWADLTGALPHQPYLREGTARFVAAGTVAAHKGIDLILEASVRLKSEGLPFLVDIYGSGEVERYAGMTRALGVSDCVTFKGPRPQAELLQLYAGYDAFLFPTWEREPFGFAPIEAAGSETPPIMTRNCGAAERVVDNVHCIKIDRTLDELAGAMRRVASGAVDLARMGRAGRRLVSTDLSFARGLDKIEAALASHIRPWRTGAAADPKLPLLAFLKHNLSVSLRFE